MAADFTKPPYSFFAPPGAVKISAPAMTMARQFAEEVRRTRPGMDFVVAFDWADTRRIRQPRSSNSWQELGPGIDLAAYNRTELPTGVIQTTDGIELVVKIPGGILKDRPLRVIDVSEGPNSVLILR